MLKRSLIVLLVVIGLVVFFTSKAARAGYVGDGICEQTEMDKLQCTKFYSGSTFLGALEIVPSAAGEWPILSTCQDPSSGATIPCSLFVYRFDGPSGDNQINLLISDLLGKAYFPGTTLNGCSQFITDGEGDPTTGFGKNVLMYNVCRFAFNPPVPPPANLAIATGSGVSGRTAVQLKAGKSIAAGEILGPSNVVPQMATTTQTITRPDGYTLTLKKNQGGDVIQAETTSPGGVRDIPLGQIQLCVPNAAGLLECQFISYATDGCDIKTLADPDPTCHIVGGKCLWW